MRRNRILLILGIALVVIILTVAAMLLTGKPRMRNAGWTPIVREFDGVPMVQVPAGCFMMGYDGGGDDEEPVHEQCFDAPFFIDQTEVTQAQFARLGGVREDQGSNFAGDNRPVERIDWFDARDFCLKRGARLPTEAEWEYAARGPDALVYPWGDSWDPNRAIWEDNAAGQTVDVGSIPAGVSWVGALDMAGNVWEWTRSEYAPYPYEAANDLPDDASSEDIRPTIRGGAWNAGDPVIFRAPNRRREVPMVGTSSIGFRCVRVGG
ncbi:MAG: formylglycine-generating enzyme family protein [Anaerolineae bacterium]|nr:formylglycine-generating enzyme family protein [Anaerolineae bacterium]